MRTASGRRAVVADPRKIGASGEHMLLGTIALMRPSDAKTADEPRADRAADPNAVFTAHFKESFRVLWGIAVGVVGDSAAADDVVQEAAIIGLDKIGQFRTGTSFAAWMGQIVRFVGLNHVRKRKRNRVLSLDSPNMPEGADPEDRAGNEAPARDGATFDARITAALASVGDVARACMILRTVEGMEYSKIAEILGIPQGTAMSHVHRTRKTLRDRLGRRDAPETADGVRG